MPIVGIWTPIKKEAPFLCIEPWCGRCDDADFEGELQERRRGNALEPEEEFTIVRTKRFPIKPMSVEEAVLQMNLLDHAFFAFRNEDAGGAFAVVYKRTDGGYGLIEDGDE